METRTERPIKILLATGLYPPEIGGPATYARMLEEELPQRGVELITVPYGTVRHLPKIVRHVAYTYALWRQTKNIDVIYALDPISVGLPAWLVSYLCRRPFMIRLGGDYAWEQGQQRFGLTASLDDYTKNRKVARLPVRVLAAVQGFVVRRAQRVIVPSEYLKSIVATWGVRQECLRVIYSALFPLVVESNREGLREQLAFNGFVIASVGRLVPWKGFSTLINVVKVLKDQGVPVTLVIAGDGPSEGVLKQQIATLGLENEVRLLGRLSKDALGAVVKAADVFVLNTSYEGLSHQLLEVMDLGTPIVTTRVGGNPELITDNMTGLLIDYNDQEALCGAILTLKDDGVLREKVVTAAMLRTHDFHKEIVIETLVSEIKSLV